MKDDLQQSAVPSADALPEAIAAPPGSIVVGEVVDAANINPAEPSTIRQLRYRRLRQAQNRSFDVIRDAAAASLLNLGVHADTL